MINPLLKQIISLGDKILSSPSLALGILDTRTVTVFFKSKRDGRSVCLLTYLQSAHHWQVRDDEEERSVDASLLHAYNTPNTFLLHLCEEVCT